MLGASFGFHQLLLQSLFMFLFYYLTKLIHASSKIWSLTEQQSSIDKREQFKQILWQLGIIITLFVNLLEKNALLHSCILPAHLLSSVPTCRPVGASVARWAVTPPLDTLQLYHVIPKHPQAPIQPPPVKHTLHCSLDHRVLLQILHTHTHQLSILCGGGKLLVGFQGS